MTVSFKKSRDADYHVECMKDANGIVRSKDDYFTMGGKEPPGTWFVYSKSGATEHLGIKDGHVFGTTEQGESDVDKYKLLMDGFNPDGGKNLVRNAGAKGRVKLYDTVFSPPKSWSAVWGIASDALRAQLGKIQYEASKYALNIMLSKVQTREGEDGVIKNEAHTVMGALFEHGSSRENDMQVHTHCVIANVGWTAEGKSTALEIREMLRQQGVAGCAHAAYVAYETRKLGFAIEANDKNFEIAGVPEEVIEHFSTRRRRIVNAFDLTKQGFALSEIKGAIKLIADVESIAAANDMTTEDKDAFWLQEGTARGWTPDQIEKIRAVSGLSSNLAKRGFTAAEIRATYGIMATLATEVRDAKNELTRKQLIDMWRERAEKIGFTMEQIEEIRNQVEHQVLELTEQEMLEEVKAAVDEIMETEAVFTEETLRVATLTKLVGKAHPDRILEFTELYKQRNLIQGEKNEKGVMRQYFTTREMLAMESEMIRLADRREGKHILKEVAIDKRLRAEQVTALKYVTSDENAVSVIEGTAGAGKTFVARAIAEQFVKNGYSVVGLAGGWKQAINLQQEAGLEDGRAITGWLNGVRKGTIKLDAKTLILLDEAGMVGAQQMRDVLKVAEEAGAKVILLGDTLQQKSVAAGDALRCITKYLQTAQGVGSVRLNEITRQERELDRKIVHALFLGGFDLVDGKKVEKPNGTRWALDAMRLDGRIIMEKDAEATHARMISDWIRMKAEHKAWAEANLHNPDEKIRKSAERVLDSVHGEIITIAADNKSVKALNELAHAARLAAGELSDECLSIPTLDTTQDNPMQTIHVGETVAIRKTVEKNGKKVSNREMALVTGIVGDRLILLTESGSIVDMDTTSKEWMDEDGKVQLTYGYSITANSSQGISIDLVLNKDGLLDSAKAGVMGSRHRKECLFYVDRDLHYQNWLSKQAPEDYKPPQEFTEQEVIDSMVNYWGRESSKDSTLDFEQWLTPQGAPINVISEQQIVQLERTFEMAKQEVERIRQESKIPEAPIHQELPFQKDEGYRVDPPPFEANEKTGQAILDLNQSEKIDMGALNQAAKDRFITFSPEGQPLIVGRKEDGTAVATYDLQGNRLGEQKPLAERYAPILSGDPKRVDLVPDGLTALQLRSTQIEEKDRTTIIVAGHRDEALGMPHVRNMIEEAKEVRRVAGEEKKEISEVETRTQGEDKGVKLTPEQKEMRDVVRDEVTREPQTLQATAAAHERQATKDQTQAQVAARVQSQPQKAAKPQPQVKSEVQTMPRQELEQKLEAVHAQQQAAVQAPAPKEEAKTKSI